MSSAPSADARHSDTAMRRATIGAAPRRGQTRLSTTSGTSMTGKLEQLRRFRQIAGLMWTHAPSVRSHAADGASGGNGARARKSATSRAEQLADDLEAM